MMHRIIAICLLTALLMNTFSRVAVYSGFKRNRQYIAKTLCENRNKPQLHCNGRCYLAKKIKQAEEKEKRQEEQDQKPVLPAALLSDTLNVLADFFKILRLFPGGTERLVFPRAGVEIFHPPPVC